MVRIEWMKTDGVKFLPCKQYSPSPAEGDLF